MEAGSASVIAGRRDEDRPFCVPLRQAIEQFFKGQRPNMGQRAAPRARRATEIRNTQAQTDDVGGTVYGRYTN